jgi:hypothetical protein
MGFVVAGLGHYSELMGKLTRPSRELALLGFAVGKVNDNTYLGQAHRHGDIIN